MNAIQRLLTEHIGIWTAADTEKKSGRGRSSGNAASVYGIRKLRELILELAVRGKLVPQDANDEPARELLKRIQAEKAKLIAEGKIKKDKPLPPITADEKPFELPNGWEWVRFGNIAQHNSGKTLDSGRNTGSHHDYITTSNLYWGRFDLANVRQMPIRDEEFEKCSARKGDLLICEGGEAGRAAVWFYEKEICFQNHIHRARLYCEIDPYYVYRFFEKLNATGEINQYRQGVGISNMSGKALASIILPIPPLAEQHRIVAKADELMALCDQLEAQHNSAAEAHEKLVDHLLGTLTQSQNAQDFSANWQRIAAHFDTLFTTEASIDALKQTLLQLAVIGKLVPQDPNDEPASALLKRIQAEKARLIAEGKIKKDKPLKPLTDEERPYALPRGWHLASFSELGEFSGGKTPNTSRSEYWDGDIPWVTPKDMKSSLIVETEDHVSYKAVEDGLAIIPPRSILVVVRSGILRRTVPVAINAECCTVNQDLKVLQLFQSEMAEYIRLMIQGFEQFIMEKLTKIGTTVESIKFDEFSTYQFPLPPLAEQHRIVAKVDELIALCDQLKTSLTAANQLQQKLADVMVEQAIA